MAYTPDERKICRIVGTPIGNLADFTKRAIAAIEEADVVFAEDTRTAKNLLYHFNINKPIRSYHKDNETQATANILMEISGGKSVVLISEAGMPVISDPGFPLMKALIENDIPHEVVPGVSAGVHAAVASGLCETGQYLFYGFLPHKNSDVEKVLDNLKSMSFPIIFYESPHRVVQSVQSLLKYFDAPIAVCRELTKLHEEVIYINSADDIDKIVVKGEFCLVVNGNPADVATNTEISTSAEKLATILSNSDVPVKSIAMILKELGIKRNSAYEIAQHTSEQN